jgi:hypothetical protein
MAGAALLPAYLAATSFKAGPTIFLSTAWQPKQFLACASSLLAMAGATKQAPSKLTMSKRFMGFTG